MDFWHNKHGKSSSVIVVAVIAMRDGGPVKSHRIRLVLFMLIALNIVLLLGNLSVIDLILEILG